MHYFHRFVAFAAALVLPLAMACPAAADTARISITTGGTGGV